MSTSTCWLFITIYIMATRVVKTNVYFQSQLWSNNHHRVFATHSAHFTSAESEMRSYRANDFPRWMHHFIINSNRGKNLVWITARKWLTTTSPDGIHSRKVFFSYRWLNSFESEMKLTKNNYRLFNRPNTGGLPRPPTKRGLGMGLNARAPHVVHVKYFVSIFGSQI